MSISPAIKELSMQVEALIIRYNQLLEIVKRTAKNTCCLCCSHCLACDATELLKELGEIKP